MTNYSIVEQSDHRIVLQDMSEFANCKTITNAAEEVVQDLAPLLGGRRLFYFDSSGELTELFVKDGRFGGFGICRQNSISPANISATNPNN